MYYSKLLGIAAPELNWVPSPSYILRRAAILDQLEKKTPGRVLEVGCGPAALLHDLSLNGFNCTGVEFSSNSLEIAKKMLSSTKNVDIHESFPETSNQQYDYLLSFEVLEHIEYDLDALKVWTKYLKPGGLTLISVPAHNSRWNVTDLMAGHYRRYDRPDIEKLILDSGLDLVKISTYGWPASWLIERLRLIVKERQLKRSGLNVEAVKRGDQTLTKASGSDRKTETKLFPYYTSFPGRLAFKLAIIIQRFFYKTDFGTSYFIVAQKPI